MDLGGRGARAGVRAAARGGRFADGDLTRRAARNAMDVAAAGAGAVGRRGARRNDRRPPGHRPWRLVPRLHDPVDLNHGWPGILRRRDAVLARPLVSHRRSLRGPGPGPCGARHRGHCRHRPRTHRRWI